MTLLPHLHVSAFPRISQHCQHCIHLAEDQTSSALCSSLSVMQFQRSQVRATNGVERDGLGGHDSRSAWVHLSGAISFLATAVWQKEQAIHCCAADVCHRQSVNQLYNKQKIAELVLFAGACLQHKLAGPPPVNKSVYVADISSPPVYLMPPRPKLNS